MADEELREAVCPICEEVVHAPGSFCPMRGRKLGEAVPLSKDDFERCVGKPPVADDLTDDEYLAKMDAEDARVPLHIEALRAASRITAAIYGADRDPTLHGKTIGADEFTISLAEDLARWLEKGER